MAHPLALTFDDGPDPRGTPAVLAALRDVGARATFFVMGPCVERHPELIEAIAADGHRLELHCDRHVRHTDLTRPEVRRDTEQALARLGRRGVQPSLWRVPWGITAPFSEALAGEFGLELIGWDVDSHDWRGDRASDMFARTRPQLTPGAVVLAHDGIGPGARRTDAGQTAVYVELVAGAGWELSTL